MLGKRLINSNDAGAPPSSCTTNTNDYPTTNVAYYKMSSAADEKGTYNGTATDVNFNVQGKFGNAGEFNGSTSSILLPNTMFNTAGVLSVSVWFKTTETGGYGIVLANRNGTHTFFIELYDDGTLQAGNWQGGSYNISTTSTVNDGNWHHYVYVNNSGAISVYLDGALEDTGTQTFLNQTITNGNQIGNYDISNSEAFDGSIDQVRIFSSALDATQVASLYNEVYCVPTIVPSDNFNTVLYTGTGVGSKSVTDVGFQPDLVWGKATNSSSLSHILFDVVRGENKQISSDLTAAEVVRASAAYEFDDDGFTVTTAGNLNNPNDFVAWCWKAGGAAVQNNDGTIQGVNCLVSANVDAGFSIVSYTGNGVNPGATIGHGLNKNPDFIITKSRSTGEWPSFHSALPISNTVYLNDTYASSTYLNRYSAINTETFTTGSSGAELNANGIPYIAYCFHSVDGYSKIGSYTGTGATGNTIVTGFRPAFVMFKVTSEADHWIMFDNKRGVVSDSTGTYLLANLSQAEGSISPSNIKFLSNGFEITGSATYWNKANASYIFMAFAEEALPYVTRNATNPFGDSSELALYKFEDDATDAEGNYDATSSPNVTYASGYIDKAAVFNGSSSQVALPKIPELTDDVSVSLWVNLASTSSGSYLRMIALNGVSNDGTLSVLYNPSGGNWLAYVGNGNTSSTQVLSHTYALTQSTWYHICVTRNDSTNVTKLYVNGSEKDSETVSATATIQSNATGAIGTSVPLYSGTVWNGSIDQVRIFNRALDDGEVTALYNE